jgi:hypothetical protein
MAIVLLYRQVITGFFTTEANIDKINRKPEFFEMEITIAFQGSIFCIHLLN